MSENSLCGMEEVVLCGLSLSKGIAMGKAFFPQPLEVSSSTCDRAEVDPQKEIQRYRTAIQSSRVDLERLQRNSLREGSSVVSSILSCHLAMLWDPHMTEEVENKIQQLKKKSEFVFPLVIEEYTSSFHKESVDGPVKDVIDVARRVLRYLNPKSYNSWSNLTAPSIAIAEELSPSDGVETHLSFVCGFVTHIGGFDSHLAIIARAKNIPFVTHIDLSALKKLEIQQLIVDGNRGKVILNPSQETLRVYEREVKEEKGTLPKESAKQNPWVETSDGRVIFLWGNSENLEETELLVSQGLVGIGLFRSEYSLLQHENGQLEESQFTLYRKILDVLSGRPLVLRLFDIGSDKSFASLPEPISEPNPALGCRALRFLFRHPEFLRMQLRAVLRASHFGPIHLLLPFVSDVYEIREIKSWLTRIKTELLEEGIPVATQFPIGCMIEVPSSAVCAEIFAKEVDFFSIGTNDLVQYTMAWDRAHQSVENLFPSAHPAVLHLLSQVVKVADRRKMKVTLCGEMAADPLFLPLLIGLGIQELSLRPTVSPDIRRAIQVLSFQKAKTLVRKALRCSSSQEVMEMLRKF